MENITRRGFVIQSSRLLAFLPLAGVAGCLTNPASKLSPEDALKRLIYIVGPWPLAEVATAENFAKRFLKTSFADQYLSKSVQLVQSLAKQLSEESIAVKEIKLDDIPEEEQEILLNLTKQLYNFVEIRFYVTNQPSWGQCQNNSRWHTKIPE